ncbi:MAG: hypothetical protein ACM358_17070 [Gemmatimonadota bacterium]
MKLACPYCGAPIGDGAPTHLTPVRYSPRAASVEDFRKINLDQLYSHVPREEVRAIQSCPAEPCKAAAVQVQPRVAR